MESGHGWQVLSGSGDEQVVAGQTAALALKRVKRSMVRKGMVLVAEAAQPRATWEFDADIAILTHATTIQPRYQAVIHCEIVRQASSSSTECVFIDFVLIRDALSLSPFVLCRLRA